MIYLALLFVFFILRIPYFNMPVHGDAGYFVSPKCTEKRRLALTGGWFSNVGAASKLIPSLFYQLCYIISPKHYKYTSRIAFTFLLYGAGVLGGFAAHNLFGISPYLYTIVFIMYTSMVHWGGYVESGDQFNVIFATAVIYFISCGGYSNIVLAVFIASIDIWFCKQSAAFMYAPILVYLGVLHPGCIPSYIAAFLSVTMWWVIWTACNGFTSPLDALKLLLLQQKSHKGSNSWIKQYLLKIRKLVKQLAFSLPLMILSILGIFIVKSPLPALMLLGSIASYLIQTNICWYFAFPLVVPLALLASSLPVYGIVLTAVLYIILHVLFVSGGYEKMWKEMFVYAHLSRASFIDDMFKRHPVPSGKVLAVIGNDTQCYILNPGAICPSPNWITYSWLWGVMTGEHSVTEPFDYYYIMAYLPKHYDTYELIESDQRYGITYLKRIDDVVEELL